MTPELLADEKKFYERFWALHSDPDLTKIFAHFGHKVFRRSSVLEGFLSFIKSHDFSGKCCVEIGTCKGLTAILLSRFFREVVTIDIVADPERQAIAQHVNANNIRFIVVENNAEKAEVIKSLSFDAAYVDGDHARDTQSDFDLVRRCGRVLFHEYWSAQPAVFDLVHNLNTRGNVFTEGKLALWRVE